MDHPSIMKILEDDEADESQYSGADVDAITAELNRDIEGDAPAPAPQPSDSNSGKLTHGNNETSNPSQLQIASENQQEETAFRRDQQEQPMSDSEPKQQVSGPDKQQQQEDSQSGKDQVLIQQNQSHGDKNTAHSFDKKQVQTFGSNSSQPSGPANKIQALGTQQHPAPRLTQADNQQGPQGDQANTARRNNISFQMLMPVLRPHLDKDKDMQLQAVYDQLRKNEINKEHFLRVVRHIVGDQMLRMAAQKVQMQQQAREQTTRNAQLQPQAQNSFHQPPSSSAQHFSDSQYKHQSPMPPSSSQMKVDPPIQTQETIAQKSGEAGLQSEAQGLRMNQVSVKPERDLPMSSMQPANKQTQQQQKHHVHLPPASYSMYGGPIVSNYGSHLFGGSSITSSSPSLKAQTQDSQVRHVPHLQNMVPSHIGTSQPMNMVIVPKFEPQTSTSESKNKLGGSLPHMASHLQMQPGSSSLPSHLNKEPKNMNMPPIVYPKQEPVDKVPEQPRASQLPTTQRPPSAFPGVHSNQGNLISSSLNNDTLDKQSTRIGSIPSTSMIAANHMSGAVDGQQDINMQLSATVVASGANMRTPPKKPTVGQKKPLESLDTASPPSSKKQKVAGALLDQSIELLNDVTAVSGVNLREEEEQLLAAPKEESRASEATRKVAQEEEERLILQRGPLRKKIAEIMNKYGIRSTSNDVERCLSLSVEERMRGLITNMIRVSKQRVDMEKPRHGRNMVVTSDVRRQILLVNRKAKEEWDKKQAEEAEKQRKINEPEGNTGADPDNNEARSKAPKANKEEDDKMRATAANVAARAAVGGDDMLSKWQLMAEQARQKREGGVDASFSNSEVAKDVVRRRPLSAGGKPMRGDAQDAENKGPSAAGTARKFGRGFQPVPSPKIVRNISVKDVITVLERDLQMSKSPFIHRLYERMQANSATD